MKYPNKIKKGNLNNSNIHSSISFKNKGDNLEYDLNLSNHYYLGRDIAVIHKKPTPIKVVEIANEKRPVITKGFFQMQSTTDYNGLYRGKYIDFEAKETASNTAFSLKNIHQHQVDHLLKVEKHGGIAFLLVLFINLNELYLLKINDYIYFTENYARKSIPIQYFRENAALVSYNFHPRIDYLKTVDIIYFGGKNEEQK